MPVQSDSEQGIHVSETLLRHDHTVTYLLAPKRGEKPYSHAKTNEPDEQKDDARAPGKNDNKRSADPYLNRDGCGFKHF